jgi:hypothetical protein
MGLIITRDRMTDMFESMTDWTNERAIAQWDQIPRAAGTAISAAAAGRPADLHGQPPVLRAARVNLA